jgi:hypothetical protein
MLIISLFFLVSLIHAAVPSGGLLDGGERIRVIITADIGGSDPNDVQSFVHFLTYSDLFDVEGLISSAPGGRKSKFLDVINAYEKDYPNLKTYSPNYPTPTHLRSVTREGKTSKGWGSSNDGSRLIIQAAKKNDPRPLYILAWGSQTNEGIALRDDPSIGKKLRLHAIGPWNTTNGDPVINDYIRNNHHEIFWIIDRSTFRGASSYGVQSGDLGDLAFAQQHVRSHGALGNACYSAMNRLKLNQTTTVLYHLRGNPNNPTTEHWGGAFVSSGDKAGVSPNFWQDNPASALMEGSRKGAKTVSKWRVAWLRDWQARMDRCKAPATVILQHRPIKKHDDLVPSINTINHFNLHRFLGNGTDFQIYDMRGKRLSCGLNIRDISRGVYFLQIMHKKDSPVYKFINVR